MSSLSHNSIIFSSLKLQNFGYLWLLNLIWLLNISQYNFRQLFHVDYCKLIQAWPKTKRLVKMVFFSNVPNSTTAQHTPASQKIWGYCKPINKDLCFLQLQFALCNVSHFLQNNFIIRDIYKSRSRIPGIWGIFSNPNPGIICLEIPGLIKFSIPLIDRLMSAYGSEHHVMLQF